MEALILTFESVNFTMMTEKKLIADGYMIKTIPTPREISKSCGLAIIMDINLTDEMKKKKDEGLPIGYLWHYYKNSEGATALLVE